MAQKLSLPFQRPVLSAGFLNEAYEASWTHKHYGWDMGCDEAGYKILSPGAGRVAAAGLDGSTVRDHLGYCVAVVYEDVVLHDGSVRDVACHMFHMAALPRVRAGDRVQRGTVIGDYGNTGGDTSGPHLHIEFTLDAARPQNAAGVAAGGKIIRRAPATEMISPANAFYFQPGQGIRGCTPYWFSQDELRLVGDLDAPTKKPALPAAGIVPDTLVTIKRGAKYGGLTAAKGRPVPVRFTGGQTYYVTAVATHGGVREALIGTLMSWIPVDSLEVA